MHAGLLINFDCSCMWFREGRAAWAREALSLTPEYLRHHANDLDYKARSWLWMLWPPSLWSAIAFTLAPQLAVCACPMISTVPVLCRPRLPCRTCKSRWAASSGEGPCYCSACTIPPCAYRVRLRVA